MLLHTTSNIGLTGSTQGASKRVKKEISPSKPLFARLQEEEWLAGSLVLGVAGCTARTTIDGRISLSYVHFIYLSRIYVSLSQKLPLLQCLQSNLKDKEKQRGHGHFQLNSFFGRCCHETAYTHRSDSAELAPLLLSAPTSVYPAFAFCKRLFVQQ